MISLDFSNVTDIFRNLSLCGDDKITENIPIIEDEIFRLENLVDENKFKENYQEKCEYAAAVCAFYDYLCKEYAREKNVLSQTGEILSSEDFSHRILSAGELKKQALDSIDEILKDREFLFITI